jgi:hypothetical protein
MVFLSWGLRSYLLGLAISSVTSSFLQERGETGVRVYEEGVLQGFFKHLNMTFSGQEWVFQQDSVPAQKPKTTQDWLLRNVLAFISAENWLSASADLKTLDNKLWAVLKDMASRKRHNSLDSLKRIPCESNGRDPPGDGACGDSRVAGASQGLRRGIGRPFWVTLLQMKT